ncbi:MAG: hypothetical protein NTV07_00075, partial [Candidatus Omnitrophica bacterium]|nr:hypothetical protein [Candidatus Omnitrophota bacterium]
EWLSTVTAATKIRSRVNIVPFGGAMSLEGQPQAEELRRDIAALREVVNDRLQQGIPPRDETVANIGYAQSRLEDINRMVLNSVLRPQAYKDAGSVKARGTKKTRQARCELAEQYIANPVVAWNRWEEFINERNTAPVYYGTTKNKGALIENRLVDNYKRGIECLSHGQWEDAYDLAISSVTLMHENAYRYSPVTIENIRRLFLWSYHINFRRMIGGHIFRLLDRYAQTDSERLAIVDLNFLLWYDEASFTEAEWYRQIAFWHELFQDGIVYRPAILREKIRKWLLDLDRPKKVIIDDRTQTVRFTMDPYDYTPYIYAAFNDILHFIELSSDETYRRVRFADLWPRA